MEEDSTINPVVTPTTVPPVQNGAIYAQSNSAGAAIYMNGNYYGYSPITLPSLQPGMYSTKATLNGYTPNTQIITVYAGQTAPYYPVLQQSPPPPPAAPEPVLRNPNPAEQMYSMTVTITAYLR
ncbi:MAG: PEGA domain-containing protein [Methanomicrobiales archaeon]